MDNVANGALDALSSGVSAPRRRGRPSKAQLQAQAQAVQDRALLPSAGLGESVRLIGQLRSDLSGVYDRRRLEMALGSSSRPDRCYHLCEMVKAGTALACRCSADGSIYVFDSTVWVPVRDIVFAEAVKMSLSDVGVSMGDVSFFEGKLMKAAQTGAQLSPLRISPLFVGFTNGVWEFTDVYQPKYHPFSERCEVTSLLPYPYIEGADCPRWKAFLREMLDTRQIDMLQKFLGLGVYPRRLLPYKIENSLWLIGPGGNGKSVISEVVTGVYGKENIGNIDLLGLIRGGDERSWNLAHIEGRLFNYCTEVKADDITRYSDQFKSLCSGEPQLARRLRENVHTMTDVPYLIFNMNHKPRFEGQDLASERRLLYIVFRKAVRKEDMNPHLAAELAEEYSGIRNWMMEGFRHLVAENYKMIATEQSLRESDEYLLENDQTVAYYLRKRGLRAYMYTTEDMSHCRKVLAARFYQDYVEYIGAEGLNPVTMAKFGRELGRLQFRKIRHGQLGYIYDVYSDEELPFELKN